MLPKECVEEIRLNADNSNISYENIGKNLGYEHGCFKITKNCQISDVKAKAIIHQVYAPKTYKLLMAQYVPIKITKIENNGARHV